MNQTNIAARTFDERRFDRGAWWTLAVVAGWFVFLLAITLWAAQYPQDGWTHNGPLDPDGHYVVDANIAQTPSPLQTGDEIMAINGQPLVNGQIPPLPSNPQVRQLVHYTIRRAGQIQIVEVQLVQPGALVLVHRLVEMAQETPRDLVIALVSFLVAAFAFALRPGNLGARYLILFYGFYLAVQLFGFGISGLYEYAFPPAVTFVYSFLPAAWGWYFFPTLCLLALAFPVVKAPLRRFPRLLPALLYGVPLGITAVATYLVVITRDLHWADAPIPIFIILLVLAVVSIFGTLIHNWFTVREPVARAQLRWVTLGMGAGLGLTFLIFTVSLFINGRVGPETTWLLWLMLLLPICLAIAITRYRLFDIDILIRKTLVYSVLTGLLALIYFGGVVLLQQLTRSITSESSDVAIAVSTLMIAALFFPLRRRVQNVIDKRFYRRKYDAQKVLDRFAVTARDEVELDKLKAELINVVNETMQPVSVSLWLKPRPGPGKEKLR